MRFFSLLCAVVALAASANAEPLDPSLYSGMRWRLVGPFRGGRSLSATGVPGEPDHFYFGAVGGGVWETKNAGRTWMPIFDSQPIASIGAVAVAPSRPATVYVGSGEADMRSDISHGNGVYKSLDGGRTWAHAGLSDTRQIGRILVDPGDPNLVFVAALGHGYGPNSQRGVFRSRDGGRTWARVLFRDEHTGAIDLAFAPGNAKTIFAALWQTRRPPWNVYPPSNGPGSGLYRSDDGGDTWKPVLGNGFPSEGLGRIGLAFAPGDRSRLYAIVDAKEGGLYASRDGGATWKRASSDVRVWGRGWYFGGVTVDPRNADTVYVCNTSLYRSTDGGANFLPVKGDPTGDDFHQLWIDPADPRRRILASDQGTVVSVDGGKTWSSWYNQPTAQLYHVVTDDRFPYWLYGAQQDSGAVAVPSRTDYPSIMLRDWRPISGGGESGAIAPDPADPNVLFGGTVGRFDQTTLQEQNVNPALAHPGEYRSEWTLPLTFSPRNPRALYFGNQFLFKTMDGGQHWVKISPDLTREAPGSPATLVPADAENSSAPGPRRGVVYAIAPSPLRDGLIWCGTDDGLVWITRDEGAHWEDVTPSGLTPWSKIGILEPSRFEADTVYAAVDRHRLDDLRPWIYRTRDGGRTWTLIIRGIPEGSFVNVVREDPVRRGLLYAGTETGVFVSFDDGGQWQPLQLNLPTCSIRDIAVRRNDLVVATHGRSFWILDDVTPLQHLNAAAAEADAWLFSPRETVRFHPAPFQGTPEPKDEPAGENPAVGARIDYLIRSPLPAPIRLEISDARGDVVRRWSSDERGQPPDLSNITSTPEWVAQSALLEASPGMHRFLWDLRYMLPEELRSERRSFFGVSAPPGRYTVRLTAAGRTFSVPLTLARDPRLKASDADLARQLDLTRSIESERVALARALARARRIRETTPDAPFFASLDAIVGTVDPATEESQPATETPVTLQRAATSLLRLQEAVESADAAPTPDAVAAFAQRRDAARELLRRFDQEVAKIQPRAAP
ncbi:MAG: sialidase family protein [Acidobacteriota bacterium]